MTLCRCGHPAYEHHTSFWPGGSPAYGECLHYGFNETGGLRLARFGWLGLRRRWVAHCDYYVEAM